MITAAANSRRRCRGRRASIAYLQADKTFRPSLKIRDYRYAAGELSNACAFEELYLDPDRAIQRALDTGRRLIDDLLDLVNLNTRIEANEAYRLARFRYA